MLQAGRTPADQISTANMKPIICVTEFDEYTGEAVRVAHGIARRFNERILLVRSVDERELFPPGIRDRLTRQDQARLARETELLRQQGFDVEPHMLHGAPDESIARFARQNGAGLIVLGCPPRSRLDNWVLGCTGEQIALTTEIPLLLVRSAAPFLAWTAGQRPLRVYALVDPEHLPTIQRELADLRQVAEEQVELHDTPSDSQRHPHDAAVKCAAAAHTAGADVIAIGTDPQAGLPLLSHLTLAGCLLREAPLSILCVPETRTARPADAPRHASSYRSAGGTLSAGN
jgi:nucleotide-binding universal stress UspA family protein